MIFTYFTSPLKLSILPKETVKRKQYVSTAKLETESDTC